MPVRLDINPRKNRQHNCPKVLCLGMSYPSVIGQMDKHGYARDLLDNSIPSIDQAVECVRRGIFTQMSARDYARCVATEEVNCVDVYTVLKETGAIYNDNRHVYGDASVIPTPAPAAPTLAPVSPTPNPVAPTLTPVSTNLASRLRRLQSPQILLLSHQHLLQWHTILHPST
jgi:hypothetical protein